MSHSKSNLFGPFWLISKVKLVIESETIKVTDREFKSWFVDGDGLVPLILVATNKPEKIASPATDTSVGKW